MSAVNAITSKSAAYIFARTTLGDVRKVYDSLPAAIAALKSIFAGKEGVEFPASFPVVAAGIGLVDVTGDDAIPPFTDEAWTPFQGEGVSVAVAFIGTRGLKDSDGKDVNGAKGFAIYPMPSLDAIIGDESGNRWLMKIAEKEASHVAFRGLRNVDLELGADALGLAAKEMPLSVSDYVEESTREGTDTAAFDAYWSDFRKMLAGNPSTSAMVSALPTKPEVIKSIRSKAYATENFGELESINAFEFIGQMLAQIVDSMNAKALEEGKEPGYDSSEIRGWLAGRETKVFPSAKKAAADLSTVDFGKFMSGMGG